MSGNRENEKTLALATTHLTLTKIIVIMAPLL